MRIARGPLGLLIESYRLHIWAFGIGPTLTSIINEHLSYLCLSTWWHMQCIVSAFRAGYEHGMYHPGTCCQVSYIPSSGWGGSCLPSGTSPTLIISEERFSPNPNSFLTKILKILPLYFVSKQVVVQQNMHKWHLVSLSKFGKYT